METSWLTELAGDLARSYGPNIRDLGLAYALAFIIGWNRERESNSAGLRTFPLVAIASCGFVQAAESITADSPEATARIVEGVITGIGFIGAGAILKGGAAIRGTATAASIWATGAMGAAVALGSYHVAVTVCLFTAATLYALTPLKTGRGAAAHPAEPEAATPPRITWG
ncbi:MULTISPECIES: MgtC/SapB family protein [Roseomonadaceae]|uniref:MgtC/SapB family protein n=1 Tax=Roseomonadaceae TaxID=3385906 RepID=UPI001C237434|nr:MgtC/SapB family protein [Roseomonas oleicola]